jgi:predicted unusual protein kinase regulating ubiquinone biosynthesis (AarF/ABC1/UbiB family)
VNESKMSQRRTELAIDLKNKFISLGPTFVKIGQLISTRPDLFPKEYHRVFKDLQDNAPSFSSDLSVKTIEEELRGSIGDIFDNFNATPIAAASIGQVHMASLNGVGTYKSLFFSLTMV